MKDTYRKFARNVFVVGATSAVQFVLGIVQLPLLTKTLGASGYGLWMQVLVTRSLLAPFTGLGLGDSLVRFLANEKDRDEIQEQFYSVILVSFGANLIVSLAVFALAYPLAMNFFEGAVQVVRLTAILVLMTPVTLLYLELFRAFQEMKKYSAFILAENIARMSLFAYLVLNGYGVVSIVLAAVGVYAVIFAVLFFLVKSRIGIKRPRFRYIREYLRFGLPLVPRSMSYWFINLSDRYVISFFLGVAPVGAYSAAYGIGGVPYIICNVLFIVLMAPISQLYDAGKMVEARTYLRFSVKYFLAIMIPFVFGAAFLAEPVLRIFSTPDVASQARSSVPLLATAVLFLGVHNIISLILIVTRKTKTLAIIWIAAALLNLGLNIILVPRIGIVGAAIGTIAAYSLVLGLVSYYSFREFKFNIDWLFILKSVFASVVMSVVVWFMAPEAALPTLLAVAVGVVVYGVIVVLLRGFSRSEISFFWSLLRRKSAAAERTDALEI